MSHEQIIMNFTKPPSGEDIESIANAAIDTLPEELMEFCDSLSIEIEELPDEVIETDMDLDDPYELVALYRRGTHVSPGVERKAANDEDVLIIFRRPLLDIWCETCDDLSTLVRQVMIEELGHNFDFSDDEIDEMTQRHFQGML